MHISRLSMAAVVAALTLPTGAAFGQGFSVNEHGTCMMGRGGTGVAAPCRDGSAIFFNPSGIVGSRGFTISAGATLIDARGGFTDDLTATTTDLDNTPIPVPHLYLTYGINEKIAVGIGGMVPYGLGTEWPATFEGRFNGYDNSLESIYIQPTVAVKPHPMLSIGAGFDFVIGRVELTQRADLSEFPVPGGGGLLFGQLGIPFHTDAANGFLEGSGTGIGGHFGIVFEPHEKFSIGVRYLTRVPIDYDGDVVFDSAATLVLPPGSPIALADDALPDDQPIPIHTLLVLSGAFSPGGALEDGPVTTALTMPDQLAAGIAVKPTPDFTFLVDYWYMNWTVFDELPVDFENPATPDRTVVENYEATHTIRVGFDWGTSDRLNLRSGFIYHGGAAPPETVTPLLPEGKRSEITFGLGYQISDDFRADAAYQYLRQVDRRGRVREAPPGQLPTVDLNSGLYEFFAHLFGLTFSASF